MNKLDVNGNNAFILASKHGRINIMKYLGDKTEIDIMHTNNDNHNAYSIHRYLCSCPESSQTYENMRLSVIYLAQIGYPVNFQGIRNFICDTYYQLYYKLEPHYYNISKYDNCQCNICKYKFYNNQTVLKCNHGHLAHVKCFVAKSCQIMCKQYNGYNHVSYPDYTERCAECNEPYIMKQSNVRVIQIN